MNAEFFEALALMEKERGVPAQYIAEKIQSAIALVVKRDYNGKDVVFCKIDTEKCLFDVEVHKKIVETVTDKDTEISLDEAREISSKSTIDGICVIKLDTKKFGRIAAQTAKHVIRQGIREVEQGQTLSEFQSRKHEIVTAQVLKIDGRTGNATVEIGHFEEVLPRTEMVADETFREGQRIKVYIVDVKDGEKGPRVMISRTHPGLVKRLFEMEVPEIYDGTIEIKSISREAGSRTKLAVFSKDESVDAVGSCIGPRGVRVNNIVDELCGEKIDIVRYSENPAEFISEALSPAKVVSVDIAEDGSKVCFVRVPDGQLSLAIGNRGQNARLAARLTGWKIDIKPESGYFNE